MQSLDLVIKEIMNVTISVNQNSDQSFIKFVDLIDRGVQDLAVIGQGRDLVVDTQLR